MGMTSHLNLTVFPIREMLIIETTFLSKVKFINTRKTFHSVPGIETTFSSNGLASSGDF